MTVRICGTEYAQCERVQEGAYWGIKTPEKTFWVFPVCDENGTEINSLPPYLPIEIRAVTLEPPDLTRRYPETVKDIFDKRRAYFTTATLCEYLKQFPNESWLTEEQFKQQQNQILSEPLEDFTRDRFLREMVWSRHGTLERANEYGYLGSVWESEVGVDGVEHRVLRRASVAMSLAFALEATRKLGRTAAWAIVSKLKFVMIYKGVPTSQFIYLEEMKGVDQGNKAQPQKASVIKMNKTAVCTDGNVRLYWEKLEEIQSTVTSLRATQKQANKQAADELVVIKHIVEELGDKEQRKKKTWRAKGGAATLKLAICPIEAKALKYYIKRRAASLGHRGMSRAIAEGREWFKSKYPDRFHIVEKMHDNSLRNFVTGKTGRRPKGNSKR